MAYIPLDEEMKVKGKAAVSILGGKIGNSSGSIVQILTFTIYPMMTYNDIAPVLMILFMIVCLVWIFAVKKFYVGYELAISSMLFKKL